MAKKRIDSTSLNDFYDDWGGVQNGTEWGKSHAVIEDAIKAKAREIEGGLQSKVSDVYVNNTQAVKVGGRVDISVPTVSTDVTNPSNPNAAQAGAVAGELNGIKSDLVVNARQGAMSADGSEVTLEFLNSENDVAWSSPSVGTISPLHFRAT